jgi:dTDP-4-amino-4,6-dideoxygalactose transaminase
MQKEKIWLSSPHMGGNEIKYVQEAFDTNWVAPLGPNVDGFEQDIVNFTNTKSAAALSSGTAALHLALILAGVKPGHKVLCASFTFAASANPIVYLGAEPVFIDSEQTTWNIDPELTEAAIENIISTTGAPPKVLIAVHLYGMPAQIDKLKMLCTKYNITLIEDAAEALGSTFNGKSCGTFGTMGVLSFNGNKIITTSGGGALISDDIELIKQARFLSTQARDAAPHYQHSQIGYNYRLSNICAGIGRGQMEVLPERVIKRRLIYSHYKQALSKYDFIQFLDEPNGFFSNRWLTCITIDKNAPVNREQLRLALEAENIESRPLWKPMHLQPIFEQYAYFGNGVSDDLFERGLCLPSGSNLTDAQFERVIRTIEQTIEKK